MTKLLIIDDDRDLLLLLKNFFQKKGYEVVTASSGNDGLEKIREGDIDLTICDYRLPDIYGDEWLSKHKILNPQGKVIIITGYSDVPTAVKCLKQGAIDYVTKPLLQDELASSVEKALRSSKNQTTTEAPTTTSKRTSSTPLGPSSYAVGLLEEIKLVGPTNFSVIITGETGSGKEVCAREIHHWSKKNKGPFIAVDCGALPKETAASELFGHEKGAFTGANTSFKGCFERASGGTLFLDEIGNLSYDHQVKLLRALQEKKIRRMGGTQEISVDIRIVVATNENLKNVVASGTFREDLFFRLNGYSINLHPLRNRIDDIPHFAQLFLDQATTELGKEKMSFSDEALHVFKNYGWPGNFRELRNVCRRAALVSKEKLIARETLPPELFLSSSTHQNSGPDLDLKLAAEKSEAETIKNALIEVNFNKTKAAKLLGIDRKTLYNKIKAFNLEL